VAEGAGFNLVRGKDQDSAFDRGIRLPRPSLNRIKGTYKLKLLKGTKTEQNRANATHEFRAEPTKYSIKKHRRDASDTIRKMKNATPEVSIKRIQPKITGWANYYKAVHSSEAFSKLDHLLYRSLLQWACRRHPLKGKKWVVDKYFGFKDGRKWVFMAKKGNECVKAIKGHSKHKVATGSYAIIGFDRQFYDGDAKYWVAGLSEGYGDITPSKAKMLKKQNCICPECEDKFTDDDLMEARRKMYGSRGGANESCYIAVAMIRYTLPRQLAAKRRFIGGGKDRRAFY